MPTGQSSWTLTPQKKESNKTKFIDLCKAPIDDQLEVFLKSFIFALGNNWKEVVTLSNQFKKACKEGGEGKDDLNVVQASDFLQKYGVTRTASQRSAEVKDIDLNTDNRISFIEYLLLQFKSMVLNEFYKRIKEDPIEDLSDSAIGVTGVGEKLIDQLFAVAKGVDPEVMKAIEEFTAMKKQRDGKIQDLSDKAALGGVKGKAAANELEQMKTEDLTDMNRIEITLNAAKRRAAKDSGEIALKKKQKEEADEKARKQKESRDRLAQRAALFNNAQSQ
ncbi:hypothetical protein MIR68_002474 [Amoeboaphelidium protococcarum]|nr:hypothetical protein MIR68_005905 [Amoeboaphelidium protococcarum]KAI3639459.1 hypothetical protein MIR68_002474 [Amoeboaphelidium protococcarum]